MQQAILYQAYGDIGNINECRFSLLKYFACYGNQPPADTAIIIYTDQPKYFHPYSLFFKGIQIKVIDTAKIKEWRGPENFIHRVKIKVIGDCFESFQGSLLYCDTDTYTLQPLAPVFDGIAAGNFYMHRLEGLLGQQNNKQFKKWNNFLSSHPVSYGGKTLLYSKDIQMWNAGVIGINSRQAYLLDDVLQLTDAIYQQFPRHIAEQFAFDYCLQQQGVIKAAESSIVHYWIIKEFRTILAQFFKQHAAAPIEALADKVKHIDPERMQNEKVNYESLSRIKRWHYIITGRKWHIEKYATNGNE